MPESKSDESFGSLLRRLRQAAGLTQEVLAERAGLSLNAIGALERGQRRHPYPHTIQLLADALGLDAGARARLAGLAARAAPDTQVWTRERTALPTPATPLLGRDREVASILAFLRPGATRLVTLTGPGGIGKTRLAIRLAADVQAEVADGAVFVSLAPITDPRLVPNAILQALGVQGAGDDALGEGLAEVLRDRALLLVLDNFEQVAGAAPLVAEMLASSPRLRVIVTSRRPLRIDGEQEFPVPPLAIPDPAQALSPDEIARIPAVALFAQRARATWPAFAITASNATAVRDLCIRLDGLPLAIELAAARVKLLSPQAMLDNLQHRLSLLVGGGPDRPARLQTMRGAINWSYDLLSPAHQALFRRLSICSGGCSLEAAMALATAGTAPVTDRLALIDTFEMLVDQSLVVREEGPEGEIRLGMFESIRDFGLDRLAELGELDALRAAHASHYHAFVAAARTDMEGAGRSEAIVRVMRDFDNLRAALAWLESAGQAGQAQQLASEVARFWVSAGTIEEGRSWLTRALAMPGPVAPSVRFDALYWASILAMLQDAWDEATALAHEALTLATAAGDEVRQGMALAHLGDTLAPADLDQAQAHVEQSLAIFQARHNPFREATSYRQLALIAQRRGDFAQAMAHHATSLTIWQQIDHPWGVPIARRGLAEAALAQGDLPTAETQFVASLAGWRLLGERLPVSDCLLGLAQVAHRAGNQARAAFLAGARTALDERTGYQHLRMERAALESAVRAALGAQAFNDAWEAGHARALDALLDDMVGAPGRLDGESVPATSAARPTGPG